MELLDKLQLVNLSFGILAAVLLMVVVFTKPKAEKSGGGSTVNNLGDLSDVSLSSSNLGGTGLAYNASSRVFETAALVSSVPSQSVAEASGLTLAPAPSTLDTTNMEVSIQRLGQFVTVSISGMDFSATTTQPKNTLLFTIPAGFAPYVPVIRAPMITNTVAAGNYQNGFIGIVFETQPDGTVTATSGGHISASDNPVTPTAGYFVETQWLAA